MLSAKAMTALAAVLLLAAAFTLELMLRRARASAKLAMLTADLIRRDARREQLVAALEPASRKDPESVEAALLAAAAIAPPARLEDIAAAAEWLGVVSRRVSELATASAEGRAQAALVLGRLRARPALSALIEALRREPGPLKLKIMEGMAELGDPASLPRFVQAAETVPASDLPEVVRLMLRFGKPAYPWLLPVINRHPESFPPERLAELLKLAASKG